MISRQEHHAKASWDSGPSLRDRHEPRRQCGHCGRVAAKCDSDIATLPTVHTTAHVAVDDVLTVLLTVCWDCRQSPTPSESVLVQTNNYICVGLSTSAQEKRKCALASAVHFSFLW
jgi:hypothetical protein